jgi:uncharacterized delta-60 repeat protein
MAGQALPVPTTMSGNRATSLLLGAGETLLVGEDYYGGEFQVVSADGVSIKATVEPDPGAPVFIADETQVGRQSDGTLLLTANTEGLIAVVPPKSPLAVSKTFGPCGAEAGHWISGIAVQPDDKVIVACGVASVGSVGGLKNTVYRFNTDLSADAGFGTGGAVDMPFMADTLGGVWLGQGGQILVALGSGFGASGLVALKADGSIQTSFGDQGLASGVATDAVLPLPDGRVICAGGNTVQRLEADGSLDATYAPGSFGGPPGTFVNQTGTAAIDEYHGLAALPDGSILVAGGEGDPTASTPAYEFVLLKLDAQGNLVNGFGQGGVALTHFGGQSIARALVIDAEGRAVLAGGMGSSLAIARFLL